MKSSYWIALCLAGLMTCGAAVASPAAGKVALRRFALIAAANDGGTGRVQLLYAHSDARSMEQVLRQLGGVDRNDRTLLLDATRPKLVEAFDRIEGQLAAARTEGVRVEFLFYYSGHSDEKGLLLAGEHLTYKEIRARLDRMPADVRIAILDSCASGALTRSKGGVWRKPFLVDESTQVRGHAFLTSASADEAAQESDRVKGSFFTHFMVTGLRGAADLTDDGRVTLNEAYQYAFHETLARTESTQAGPQHPSYDFQLTGAGDLVLTDLSKTSALFILPPELEGRVFLRDSQGRLVAEINKPGGRAVSMALEPGEYAITVDAYGELRKGTVTLARDDAVQLSINDLTVSPVEVAVARGDVRYVDREVRLEPFTLSLVPGVGINSSISEPTLNNVALNIILGYGAALDGIELSGLGAIRTMNVQGFQGAGAFNVVTGNVDGFQWAGGANIAVQDLDGFQAAGGANVVIGRVDGFQAAAGANIVGGELDGFAVAGGANIAGGRVDGFQWAGGANLAGGGIDGAQLATVNIAGGPSEGFQGGVVNIAGRMQGAQLGIVNIADEMDGPSIGLINIIGDGLFEPAFWYTESTAFNAGLKMGSRHFYSTLGFGIQPGDEGTAAVAMPDDRYFSALFGLGGHIEVSRRFWVDIDVVVHQLYRDENTIDRIDSLTKLRTTVGFRIVDTISLFAGPTLNLLVSDVRQDVGFDYALWHSVEDGKYLRLEPGIMAGIQFEPKWGRLNSRK